MSSRGQLEVNCNTIRGQIQRWTYLLRRDEFGAVAALGHGSGGLLVAVLRRVPEALVGAQEPHHQAQPRPAPHRVDLMQHVPVAQA